MKCFGGLSSRFLIGGSSYSIRASPRNLIQAHIELPPEHVVQLYGLTQNERNDASPSVLRGTVSVQVKKCVYIDAININLLGSFVTSDILVLSNNTRGRKKLSGEEDVVILDETVLLFNNASDSSICFQPGVTYRFPFEFVLGSNTPESICTVYGSIFYETKLKIEFEGETLELDSKEITMLRTLCQVSCLMSESIIVQGNWRNLLDYRFVTFNKIVQIEAELHCSVKMAPLVKKGYKIHSIKVFLIQQISLSGDTKFSKNNKMLLREHQCEDTDFDEDGQLTLEWSLPVNEVYRRNSQAVKIYPYTAHSTLSDGTPNLKITHSMKISVLLEESNNLTSSSQEYMNFVTPSSLLSVLSTGIFDSTYESTTFQNCTPLPLKKVELSLSAPIFLLHKDAIHEVPPCYDECIKIPASPTTLDYDSSDETMTLDSPVTSEFMHHHHHHRGTTIPFIVTAKPHFNQEYYDHTCNEFNSSNSWYNLVGKWNSEHPPEYCDNQ